MMTKEEREAIRERLNEVKVSVPMYTIESKAVRKLILTNIPSLLDDFDELEAEHDILKQRCEAYERALRLCTDCDTCIHEPCKGCLDEVKFMNGGNIGKIVQANSKDILNCDYIKKLTVKNLTANEMIAEITNDMIITASEEIAVVITPN